MSKKQKDFCFLWYVNDWIGGTDLFTREQKGAYHDLLMTQANNGHLSERQIETKLNQESGHYQKYWLDNDDIRSKFKVDDKGLFYNEKLEEQILKRTRFRESRKNNLKTAPNHMKDHKEKEKGKEIEKDPIPYKDIVDDLNHRLGTKYRVVQKYRDKIKARHNEGFTIKDFKIVHAKKIKEWTGTEYAKYLKPDTLWSNKFQGYLNQLETPEKKQVEKVDFKKEWSLVQSCFRLPADKRNDMLNTFPVKIKETVQKMRGLSEIGRMDAKDGYFKYLDIRKTLNN